MAMKILWPTAWSTPPRILPSDHHVPGPGHYYQLITDRVVVLNTRCRASRKLVTPDEM